MDQSPVEAGPVSQGEARAVESGLRALWDRARRAAEVIAQLREDKRLLQSRVDQLELELRQVQQELTKREHVVRQMAAEQKDRESRRGAMLADAEQDVLVAKVKALIAKLDSYL